MEGCANMSHEDHPIKLKCVQHYESCNKPYYMGQQPPKNHSLIEKPWYLNADLSHKEGPAVEYNDSFPGATYEPQELTFLEWFVSNPYKFGFYFLLGVCFSLLYFR